MSPSRGSEPMGVGIAGQFVLPIEYYRNEDDMRDLEVEIVGQEEEIATGARLLREALGEYTSGQEPSAPRLDGGSPQRDNRGDRLRWVLGKYFKKQTKSCDWPTKCEYQEVCFGPKEYTLNPLSSQLYQIRTPNHPVEREFD